MDLEIEIKSDEILDNITSIPTTRRLTPAEFALLIIKRATMIANGDPCVLSDIGDCYDTITLARREILEVPQKVPFVVVRNSRDGTKEYRLIEDMEIRDY